MNAMFGFEQEFFMINSETNMPLGMVRTSKSHPVYLLILL